MDEKTILEAYNLIKKTIRNPKSINNRIAVELFDRFQVEQEDLIQDVVMLFIERSHQDIDNLSAYINCFTKNALLDIKKYHLRQKREHRKISLEQWMEDGNDVVNINSIL